MGIRARHVTQNVLLVQAQQRIVLPVHQHLHLMGLLVIALMEHF